MRILGLALIAAWASASICAAAPPPIMGAGAAVQDEKPSPMAAAMVGSLDGAVPGALVIRGLAGRSETLTAADVAKLSHEHVTLTHMGVTTDYSGPLLSDLLHDVSAPMGVRLHGTGVNDVLYVTGSDKYRAVLSLAEVDPGFHKGAKAILADQAGGKPLDAHDGPFRLVIDGDIRPARSVRSVMLVELKHLP